MKREDSGLVSQFLHDKLQVGENYGNFVAVDENVFMNRKILLALMKLVFRLVTKWSSAPLQENSPFRRGHSQGCVSSKSSSFYATLASALYLAKVFFGGGTGITPLMSMLREAAHDPATPVIFQGSHQVHDQSSNFILFSSTRLS